MKIPLYLAMTAAEFQNIPMLPHRMAWMACHFSPYGRGISNPPSRLPEGSMLILNDRIPYCGHDPEQIAQELLQLAQQFSCESILLDLQRDDEAAAAVVQAVCALPLPVGVSEKYAKEQPIVFLSALPFRTDTEAVASKWQGKELWLEIAQQQLCCDITEAGARFSPANCANVPLPHFDDALCCRYGAEVFENMVRFTLSQDKEILEQLLEQAQRLGISKAIALYQQFG